MFEYTRELLNSNCDLDFIKSVVERAHGTRKFIMNKVLKNNKEGKKRLIYDLTTEEDMRSIFLNAQLDEKYDYELSWKFALELIVKQLKKIFIDSNIYYENREILDIYNNISVHRLIIVEWEE
jgi:hypothetical protein